MPIIPDIIGGLVPGVIAAVDVGIPAEDNNATYKDIPSDAPYVECIVMNRYEKDGHTYMFGVAGRVPNQIINGVVFQNATAGFCQLTLPTILWIADWTVARWKLIPEIPQAERAIGSKWVLLDEHYETANLLVGPDGVTPLYRVSGTFTYGIRESSGNALGEVNFGLSPEFEDVFERTIPFAKAQPNIISKNLTD